DTSTIGIYTLSLHDALPILIEEWNSSSSAGDVESNWQKYLWLACVEKVGDKMPDKTRIAKFILRSLEDPHNQDTLKNRIPFINRSEEHTSELQSRENLVCRL